MRAKHVGASEMYDLKYAIAVFSATSFIRLGKVAATQQNSLPVS